MSEEKKEQLPSTACTSEEFIEASNQGYKSDKETKEHEIDRIAEEFKHVSVHIFDADAIGFKGGYPKYTGCLEGEICVPIKEYSTRLEAKDALLAKLQAIVCPDYAQLKRKLEIVESVLKQAQEDFDKQITELKEAFDTAHNTNIYLRKENERLKPEPQAQSVEADGWVAQNPEGKVDPLSFNPYIGDTHLFIGEATEPEFDGDNIFARASRMLRKGWKIRPVKLQFTDQPQQPTAREMLEALIEYYDNNKRWFLSSSRRSGVEYKGLTGIALLEFAEQWLKEKTKER